MQVDENPFPQPADVNMVIPNMDKFSLLRFKLVVDNGEDEPRPNAFERLERKFGTMPPIVANNYLLANEFKNKEHDKEITEENEEAAYTLECGEYTSAGNQFTHGNDKEDDGMADIEEDIDLEAERRIREISYNILLK
ncbi:Uncharacterized protein Adt_27474 [Abeliophyllum distichum]|uniref:Uncharacterized protein n=1 Tax=Abeliophyllum distichum TaxID=126358 RepID=A0ABD1RTW9_9LAMI